MFIEHNLVKKMYFSFYIIIPIKKNHPGSGLEHFLGILETI